MDRSKIETTLKEVLGVKKELVALKALKDIPQDIPSYEGIAIPGICTQIGEIIISGDLFYILKEHNGCFEGLIATGVCPVSIEEYAEEVGAFMEMSPYHIDHDTAMDYYKKGLEKIPPPPVAHGCLLAGPLSKVEDPDLVLIFCNPKQAEVLIRSQSYFGNMPKGFGGNNGCAYNIRHGFVTGDVTFSTSDFPWRMFVGLDDDELTVTFPYDKLIQSAPMIKPIVEYIDNFSSMF